MTDSLDRTATLTTSDSFSYTSTNIVYAITCTLCPKAVYIGETMQTLRKRINGHRNDYVHNRNKPVAEHFNLDNHDLDNLKVMVLKYSTSNSKQGRLIQEQKFIFVFDCVNLGLNRDLAFMANYKSEIFV